MQSCRCTFVFRHDRLQDRASGRDFDVLRHVADADTGRACDGAGLRLILTEQQAHDRRLAGAVRADQADLLAGADAKRDVFENGTVPVVLADALKSNEIHEFFTVVTRRFGRG